MRDGEAAWSSRWIAVWKSKLFGSRTHELRHLSEAWGSLRTSALLIDMKPCMEAFFGTEILGAEIWALRWHRPAQSSDCTL